MPNKTEQIEENDEEDRSGNPEGIDQYNGKKQFSDESSRIETTKPSHDELRVKIIDPDEYSDSDEDSNEGDGEGQAKKDGLHSHHHHHHHHRHEPKKAALKHKGNLLTENLNDEDIYTFLASDNILDFDSSDSSDDARSFGSLIFQRSLSYVPDFFEVLGELPSLNDISEDEDLNVILTHASIVEMEDATKKDIGQFVDPLTGEAIESTPTPEKTEEETAPEEVEEEEEETDNIVEITEDEELLILEIPEEVEEFEKKPDDDEVFETFLEMESPKIVILQDEVDFEALARAEETRLIHVAIKDFVFNIIDIAVKCSEYVDPRTIMRQNFKKTKLMQKLMQLINQMDIEQKARLFLNRKTVEYFRRKKYFRPISEDNPETISEDMQKYSDAKMRLDRQLGIEECTHDAVRIKIENLKQELSEWEQKVEEEDNKFEELVTKSLVRESYDRLRVSVQNQLLQMARLRNQISEFRYTLIQRLHTYALLVNKLDKLENIGNGLRIQDFERLQTETQILGKKIEERNTELSKLRVRCNADLHIMAHMKEKQQMLRNSITIQEDAFMQLVLEKQACRENLYNLKVKRGQVRRDIQELSFQGGLIDKPALMHDFDYTNDRLLKLRAHVYQLRAKFTDIQKKLKAFETVN